MSTQGQKLVARMLNRRGNRVNLPQPLEPGELGWCLDTRQLFIGLNDDYALKTLEIFSGIPISVVSGIMNSQIVQFSTPYVRLNVPAVVTPTEPNEEAVLRQLGAIPPSSFTLEQNQFAIKALESQIEIMDMLRTKISSSIINNYPFSYVYDWEIKAPQQAQATTTLTADVVTGVTLNPSYQGLGYTSAPTILVSESPSGPSFNAVITANISTDGNGTITGFTIVDGGTGYDTPPTITIATPITPADKSTDLYKFTYLIGIDDIGGTPISEANLAIVLDASHLNLPENYDSHDVILGYAGLIGVSGNAALHPFNLSFGVDKLLDMPTLRRTSNLAGILNKLSPSAYDGLVNAKQNVEIVTEYSSIGGLGSTVLYDYHLPQSYVFANIENTLGGSYNSFPLMFDVAENDVIFMDYSVTYNPLNTLMVRNGTIRVNVLSGGNISIDDDYTDNVDGSITGMYTFDIDAVYSSGTVTMRYKHTFPGNTIYLRVNVKKWNSFIL